MDQYHKLLRDVIDNGDFRMDRTGTGAYSVFGRQARFNLADGFPLLTTKKLHLKSIIHELLWFIKGDTNVKYLNDNGVTIWDEWKREDGDLGPIYGAQWRFWMNYRASVVAGGEVTFGTIDQLADLIAGIKRDPYGRRHIMTAWNPADLPHMALSPCHCMVQFFCSSDGRLSCQLYQRSCDIFLGVPYNITSYALLTMMIAQVCGLEAGELVHTFGDLHLYQNHTEQAMLQLQREPRKLPRISIDPAIQCIDDFRFEHFSLEGYDPYPSIKAQIAV